MEQLPSKLEKLRELNAAVKRPANVFAYALGCLSAVIMGTGMSLIMTDIDKTLGIANSMVPGIIGMGMAIVNYLIFKKVLVSRKTKYADQILALSEKIMNR